MDRRILICMLALGPALLHAPTPAAGQCDPAEPGMLLAPDPADGHEFGRSVAIDGDVLVIGAVGDDDKANNAGAAYVFRFDGAWNFEQKLTASDGSTSDVFGWSVAVKGNVIAIGAIGKNTHTGAAYVFHNDGVGWNEQAKLTGQGVTAWAFFGSAVAISEDSPDAVIAVGAPASVPHDTGMGAVYLYRREGDAWQFQTKLLAADGAEGDRFGRSLDLDPNRLMVGAPGDDDFGNTSGSVYFFNATDSVWTQEQKFVSPQPVDWESFGYDVSLFADSALIGPFAYSNACDCPLPGRAYVFRLQDDLWNYEAMLLPPQEPGFSFGQSVALGADIALIGAPDGLAAYLFRRNPGGKWALVAEFSALGDPYSSWFGYGVALSGTTALVADVYYGTKMDYNRGAAFVFDICGYVGCYADTDGSGKLDLFDFLAFVNLFNGGDGAADCDASGALDLFDFFCFVNAFNEGCG